MALRIIKSVVGQWMLHKSWKLIKRWQHEVLVCRSSSSVTKLHSSRLMKRWRYKLLLSARGMALTDWRINMEAEDRERGMFELVMLRITAFSLLKVWRTWRQWTSKQLLKDSSHQKAVGLWRHGIAVRALLTLHAASRRGKTANEKNMEATEMWTAMKTNKAIATLRSTLQDATGHQQSRRRAIRAFKLGREAVGLRSLLITL